MDKQTVNLTIFLLKESFVDFDDCLKSPHTLYSSEIIEDFKIDGKIYYCNSKTKPPKWKTYLDELAKEKLN